MATGTQPLLGAYVKYKRAEEHFRDLITMIAAFKESDPYSIAFKPDPQTGQEVPCINIRNPIPPDIPLRTGEVIQCLRSSFDYIACELVTALHGAAAVTTRTAFRFYEDRTQYESARQGIEQTMGKSAVDALDDIKPYLGGNDTFVRLCQLNDREKHRFLVTTGIAYQLTHPGGVIGAAALGGLTLGAGPVRFTADDSVFPLENGTQLPPRTARAADGSQVNVNPKLVFEIAFNEPRILQREGVIDTLERFRYVALNVIARFDPIFGGVGIAEWLNRSR